LIIWSPLIGSSLIADDWTGLEMGARQWRLLAVSLGAALTVGVMAAALGLAAAIQMNRLRGPADIIVRSIVVSLAAIPILVLGAGAMTAFHRIAPSLEKGIIPVTTVQAIAFSPVAALILLGGLRSLPRSQIESASLSLSPKLSFRQVTLPMLRPAISASICIAALLSLVDFITPSLFAAGSYSQELFAELSRGGNGFLMSVPLIAIAALLSLLPAKLAQSWVSMRGRAADEAAVPTSVSSVSKVLTAGAALGFSILVIALALESGSVSASTAAVKLATGDFASSLKFAAAAACLATLLAISCCRQLSRGSKVIHWILILAPLGIPASVIGGGLSRLGAVLGLDFIAHPMTALAVRTAPVSAAILAIAWSQVDRRCLEAASLAVGPVRQITGVLLPMALPGLLLGFGISAVISLGDVEATLAVVPPGESTVLIRLFNFLHYGSSPDAAALSLAMLVVVFVLTAGTLFAARRRTTNEA
jgi:iron(III) transport system permease protein